MREARQFHHTTWILAACAAALMCPAAWAVEFTQNTLIAANDTTYDGQDIVVTGCTVTINGYHPFNSLLVRSSGVVTHSANTDSHVHFMDLVIAGSVTVEGGSRLDIVGKGYAAGKGPGQYGSGYGSGGGHGGLGGNCYGDTAAGARPSVAGAAGVRSPRTRPSGQPSGRWGYGGGMIRKGVFCPAIPSRYA